MTFAVLNYGGLVHKVVKASATIVTWSNAVRNRRPIPDTQGRMRLVRLKHQGPGPPGTTKIYKVGLAPLYRENLRSSKIFGLLKFFESDALVDNYLNV